MSERLRFRGPDSPNDWFSSQNRDLNTDLSKRLGASPRADFPALYQDGVTILVRVPEITNGIESIAHGTAKQREASKKQLIALAAHGTTADLLDTTTYALSSLLHAKGTHISPEQNALLNGTGYATLRTSEAVGNVRGFMVDLVKTLSSESRIFHLNATARVNGARALGASLVMGIYFNGLSQEDRDRLPSSFHQYAEIIMDIANVPLPENASPNKVFYVGPEISRRDVDELGKIAQKAVEEPITQAEFELTLKAFTGYHKPPFRAARNIINTLFGRNSSPEGIAPVLEYFNRSLNSKEAINRNAAQILFFLPFSDNTEPTDAEVQGNWMTQLQEQIGKMAEDPDSIDGDLKVQIENFITSSIRVGTGQFASQLFFDWQKSADAITSGKFAVKLNEQLVNKVLAAQGNPALDLLVRTHLETRSQILEEELLDLFDASRPLGYFLDNLRAHWQDLQRINREQMWPSFITARQAKLWPSEAELDILAFSRRHPAEVLGFSNIRFSTRGYAQPEVGLEFDFKNSGTLLRGRLDRDGRLVGLPFDLEERNPHIHAFLEHIAVGSFQELVTIAEKRIKEKSKEDHNHGSTPSEHPVARGGDYAPNLPRTETTYVTIPRSYQLEELQSEVVVEKASDREKLPRIIPQKVVPLAYAQRYRYLRDQLEAAGRKGTSSDEIKTLEGDVLYALSLIPRPSVGKLEHLPEQFQLDRTGDGKFLDTWRIEHIRPKPKEGEEPDLSEIFERRFKAAPIALTRHLETWFTQPPKQG